MNRNQKWIAAAALSGGTLAAIGVICEWIGIPKEVGEAFVRLGLSLAGLIFGG